MLKVGGCGEVGWRGYKGITFSRKLFSNFEKKRYFFPLQIVFS